jgi:mono/diheme cytochrome c family protein
MGATPVPLRLGAELFNLRCGICHMQMGTGTITLGRRLGRDKALLTSRTDLDANYIKSAVRGGIGSMPALTRVDLSDAELDTIVTYLARSASEHEASPPASRKGSNE